MPNDTTKTSSADRLSRCQFRNKEGETTEANKPAKPDAASASKGTEAVAKNMEEMLEAIVQLNREIRGNILQMKMDVKEFKGQTKESFTRLETSVGGLSAQLTKLEKRVVDAEECITVIRIDRAHRALMLKPKENDPPCSIVIKFTDYTVKEQILQQA